MVYNRHRAYEALCLWTSWFTTTKRQTFSTSCKHQHLIRLNHRTSEMKPSTLHDERNGISKPTRIRAWSKPGRSRRVWDNVVNGASVQAQPSPKSNALSSWGNMHTSKQLVDHLHCAARFKNQRSEPAVWSLLFDVRQTSSLDWSVIFWFPEELCFWLMFYRCALLSVGIVEVKTLQY